MADDDKKDATPDGVIAEALELFEESQAGSDEVRNDAKEDIQFARMSDQWDDNVRKLRRAEGRPCLTINKLPAFVRQVVNDSRQQKPGIKVSPVDNGADEDTAEVIGGLIRSVERGSNAEIAYDTAIDHAVSGGFGFFRVAIDYAHADSFELEARIERVPNPFMVHWDINSTEFDASDWNYAFVSDHLTLDEFQRTYPDAQLVNFEGDEREETNHWLEEDSIRVAEYFLRAEKQRKLVRLSNGMVMREEDMAPKAKEMLEQLGIDLGGQVKDEDLVRRFMELQGTEVAEERMATYHEVTRRIISGVEVLEEERWPGSTIPICPVWGEEVYSEGRRKFRSMIRDAKDPQAMFNFWRSATTELVALAPRAPWVGPQGFVPKGQEGKWATANTRSHPYLEYAGNAPPQRQPFAGVPAGALQESLNASDDMKAIIGIYDTSLGARSNETSGKAIMARQKEADNSNFHFLDNLSRAIRYAGRVLVEIVPSVYSARETVRILGDDAKEKVVKLTQQNQEQARGEPKLYNLAVGKYDVTVKTGPNFATQREETRETLIEIMRSVEGAGAYLGDVVLEHMDFVGADKVAKRLKMLLPANIQKAEAEENASDIPPEAQALVMQSQQKVQELEGMLKQGAQALQQAQQAAASTQAKDKAAQDKIMSEAAAKARELDLREQELDLKRDALAVAAEELEMKKRDQEHDQGIEIREIALKEAQAVSNENLETAKLAVSNVAQ